jgi:hypothetical protein
MAETKTNANANANESGSKVDLSKLKSKDLLALLGKLSPEQLSAVRGAAVEVGLPISKSANSTFMELADGSIRVTVDVPADLAPGLKEWALSAGEPLETFLQHYTIEALTAYSMMDWQAAK